MNHRPQFNLGYFQARWNMRLNALGWRYCTEHRLHHKGEDTRDWQPAEWEAYDAGAAQAITEGATMP